MAKAALRLRRPVTNWTQDLDGRENSSVAFYAAMDTVTRIIRDSGFDLIRGYTTAVSRLIVAQLAHVHNLGPLPPVTRRSRRSR